ncbi:MAG: viroplasmin family protein, partial [Saprospiraceae bacterium]|nr:viroplasmin family protein [Saprospiraceae bacterium]
MSAKQKFYVVWQGYQPGIYTSWSACEAQIKAYPGARYKSFESKAEAEAAFKAGPSAVAKAGSAKKASKPVSRQAIIWDSIAVDAACSGNPGVM